MKPVEKPTNVSNTKLDQGDTDRVIVQRSVILSLLYFEVFCHPLTCDELIHYSRNRVHLDVFNETLQELVDKNIVKTLNDYYFIDLAEEHVNRRMEAENRYEKNMPKARHYSTIIASFPFVRGVCISGSLSKGVAYEGGDIDYFIITKPKRLWMAKLLLVLYKRIVLFGSHKNFCLNYFLDNDHLRLEEINLFTATELASVMPMYGYSQYERLIQNNEWLLNYYPNFEPRENEWEVSNGKGKIKKSIELLFDNRLGDFIGNQFMKVVWRKYNRKHENPYSKEELAIMFKTKSYVSKVHYGNHQHGLLATLKAKSKAFEGKYGIRVMDDDQ